MKDVLREVLTALAWVAAIAVIITAIALLVLEWQAIEQLTQL